MTVVKIEAPAKAQGSLVVSAAATDPRLERKFFADRAAALAGITGTVDRIMIGNTEYVYNASGFGVTTADGRKWESVEKRREDYASDSDFNSAMTAASRSFPAPSVFPRNGEPPNVYLNQCGVTPSNLLSDGANNRGAIQAVIDDMALQTNGGIILGGSWDSSYRNPVIALDAPITLSPSVKFSLNEADHFRAAASMTSMVQYPWSSGIAPLTFCTLAGGLWSAGRLADYVFDIGRIQDVTIGGNAMSLRNGRLGAIRVGDPSQTSDNYGVYIHDLDVVSTSSQDAGETAAIFAYGNISDSLISRTRLIGHKVGVSGPWFTTRMHGGHAWSYTDGGPSLQKGFHLTGGRCDIGFWQVDNPKDCAVQIDQFGGADQQYTFSNMRMTTSDVSIVTVGDLFKWADAPRVIMNNVILNDAPGPDNWGELINGDLDNVEGFVNLWGGTPSHFEVTRGVVRTMITFDTPSDGSIALSSNRNENVASVARTADGDYTVTFSKAHSHTDYHPEIIAKAAAYPENINAIIRDAGVGSVRIQTLDDTGSFVRPETVHLTIRS